MFEWGFVILVNVGIIAFGMWKSRETHDSVDWFLAARGLPWWMVGLSMFATAVDSGDYVAVAGGAYQQGLPYISAWWLGITTGWLLVAWVVLVPMYQSGMFTNSEYLEYRFGPTARVIAVIVQFQSRTNVLANVAFSLYLTFDVLTGWGPQTWWLVVGIALTAAAYTASGGLKSVAITDTLQSIVMLAAAAVLWWSVWDAVDGWDGLESRLNEHVAQGFLRTDTAYAMTHVGGSADGTVPPLLVVFGFIVVLTSYCVINQSQAMRMLAARSTWDLRMAAVVAALATAVVMWFNVTLGILGRAVIPDLDTGDKIFPVLVRQFLLPLQGGLSGIVVAGLLAGGISTYDSVGSALASVFTRDVYARFFVKRADDRHYLLVSRIVTFVVIAVSFIYIPFLDGGMVKLYLDLVGVAVVPLLTVYLMGVLTRVSRSSGTVGLLVGIATGLTRFAELPDWWTNTWWGYPWSILVTVAAMLVTTAIQGWADLDDVGSLLIGSSHVRSSQRPRLTQTKELQSSWAGTFERRSAAGPGPPLQEQQPTAGLVSATTAVGSCLAGTGGLPESRAILVVVCSMTKLQPSVLKQFDQDGYVVVRSLLDVDRDLQPVVDEYDVVLDQLAQYWQDQGHLASTHADLPFCERLLQLVTEAEQPYDLHFDISLPQVDISEQTPMHHGPAVFNLLRCSRLLDAVEQFIGPEIYSNPVQHTRIKLPENRLPAASRTGLTAQIAWHQDLGVVTEDANEVDMLTVWFPITPVTIENGCLAVIPGSHRGELMLHCRSRDPLTLNQVCIPESLVA